MNELRSDEVRQGEKDGDSPTEAVLLQRVCVQKNGEQRVLEHTWPRHGRGEPSGGLGPWDPLVRLICLAVRGVWR